MKMKYTIEEGFIMAGKKENRSVTNGHDAGAWWGNQNNCTKFDLIDTILSGNNDEEIGMHQALYKSIKYLRVKQFFPDGTIKEESIQGPDLIIERDGYDFRAIKKNDERIFFNIDTIIELSIIRNNNTQYTDFKCWGLIDNTDDYMTIYDPAKEKAELNKLVQQIADDEPNGVEDPWFDFDVKNPDDGKKYYAMVGFHSITLINDEKDEYQGEFGVNGKYIKDAADLIREIENAAEETRLKYADKGIKVSIGDFNVGCQFGMSIYVWIPYQTQH